MPYTQTIILHITVADDQPSPTTWDWPAELDLRLLNTVNDNEFVLESWSVYEDSFQPPK